MKRYSKPIGRMIDFKTDFFFNNDLKLEELKRITSVYTSQERRDVCKNCEEPLDYSAQNCFVNHGTPYLLCSRCGHCNGAHEDTDAFCSALYSDDQGSHYAGAYSDSDVKQYKLRQKEIYLPKALFLRDSILEVGDKPGGIVDFGAGAGYFVSAAQECGFEPVHGYEPSEILVKRGTDIIGEGHLFHHEMKDINRLIETADAQIASLIGVLEHLSDPGGALEALKNNKQVKYVFLSLPLFSPTVVFESIFPEVSPRHLGGGHTHLYTDQSIDFFVKNMVLRDCQNGGLVLISWI